MFSRGFIKYRLRAEQHFRFMLHLPSILKSEMRRYYRFAFIFSIISLYSASERYTSPGFIRKTPG